MKKQTLATLTNYQQPDAYGALSMPVYHCCAFEFDTAKHMTDAFTGRVNDPEYVRVMNPTVTFFENRVKSLTGAQNVFAFNSGRLPSPTCCCALSRQARISSPATTSLAIRSV